MDSLSVCMASDFYKIDGEQSSTPSGRVALASQCLCQEYQSSQHSLPGPACTPGLTIRSFLCYPPSRKPRYQTGIVRKPLSRKSDLVRLKIMGGLDDRVGIKELILDFPQPQTLLWLCAFLLPNGLRVHPCRIRQGGSEHLQSRRGSYINSALQNRVSQSVSQSSQSLPAIHPSGPTCRIVVVSHGGGFIDKGWVLSLISKTLFLSLPLAKTTPAILWSSRWRHRLSRWNHGWPTDLYDWRNKMTTDGMGKGHNKEIRGTTGSTAPASERKGRRVFMEMPVSLLCLSGWYAWGRCISQRPAAQSFDHSLSPRIAYPSATRNPRFDDQCRVSQQSDPRGNARREGSMRHGQGPSTSTCLSRIRS